MKNKAKELFIYILSFLLPILIFVLCCACLKIFPFGEKTILVSDLANQYSSMFLFYKRLFTEGISCFYSFEAAGGTPILDMFSYYLASPFNLILLLFPIANITEGILALILLKLGLSGLTFAIFLIKKFHKKDFVITAFSLCYALMAYAVVYFYNVMWLDALIWLPLIVLGIERLFSRKKPLVFYVFLTVAIFSNWYTGYMLCIFSGIYSLYIVFRRKFTKKQLRERFKSFFKMCLYGILAVTTCAVMLLPAFLNLHSHQKTTTGDDSINFELLDLCSKFLVGASDFAQITNGYYSDTYENLPAVYCGIATVILVIMYFFNTKIKKREKIAGASVLAIMVCSFYTNFINVVWHGFNGNIWYPYRYSFVFSFFILLLAYKNWSYIDNFDKKKFLKIIGIFVVSVLLIEQFGYSYVRRETVCLTLGILLGMAVIFYLIIYKKAQLKAAFVMLVMFEIFVNTLFSINTYYFSDRNLYYNFLSTSEKALTEIQEDEISRILVDDYMAYNLGLAYGYNSLNFSSSTQKKDFKKVLQKFESVKDFENHILLFPDMPVRNMLLGNKYIIKLTQDNSKYSIKEQEECLNIGFFADKNLLKIDLEDSENVFEFQNLLLSNILGKEVSCYQPINYKEKVLENIIEEDEKYQVMSEYATLSYTLEDVEEEVYMQFFDFGNTEIYVNGIKQELEEGRRKIILIEEKENNTEVKFIFKNKGRIENKDPVFYRLDSNILTEAYKELKKGELELKEFSNCYVSGEVFNDSENKIMCFSIPNDRGWSVYVNGKKTEIFNIMDAFIGIEIPMGKSMIELKYYPVGLKIGGIISVLSIIFAIYFSKKLK